jgi:hypothetical protein
VTPLFVFTADLHLEDGAWSTRPGIYGDAYYSFAQIVDYCIEHKLPLILGGDVLERKNNSARPIAKLCEGLSRMQSAAVPVYYIQGNHEYDRNAPWLSVHPWPIHLHQYCLPFGSINGPRVYGLDWLPRGDIQAALAQVPADTDILITHQVWKDLMGNLGRTECELTDVYHVQTVLAGDFHVTKTVTGVNAQGKTVTMLSPGSICMQDLGESCEKFFFVIGREPDEKISFKPVKLETRRFASYVVKDQEGLDDLCAGKLAFDIEVAAQDAEVLPEEIKKPIFRVKFDKALPDAFLRLSTAAGDSVHLFCEALADKVQAACKNSNRAGAKNDLLAALADLLGEDSREYRLAAALVTAEDPGIELEAFFKAFFTEESAHAIVETGSPELGTPSVSGV